MPGDKANISVFFKSLTIVVFFEPRKDILNKTLSFAYGDLPMDTKQKKPGWKW